MSILSKPSFHYEEAAFTHVEGMLWPNGLAGGLFGIVAADRTFIDREPGWRGSMLPIITERLDLLQASPTLMRADLTSLDALGALLDATVPEDWPPEFFERDDLERALAWAEAEDFDPAWGMRYFLAREPRRLVGVGGFFGPPKGNTVMLGYAVARQFRGLGFATEATLGLVGFALARPHVDRVAAETLPELTASIRVLEKAGFRRGGSAQTHPGAIRFGRSRDRSDLRPT